MWILDKTWWNCLCRRLELIFTLYWHLVLLDKNWEIDVDSSLRLLIVVRSIGLRDGLMKLYIQLPLNSTRLINNVELMSTLRNYQKYQFMFITQLLSILISFIQNLEGKTTWLQLLILNCWSCILKWWNISKVCYQPRLVNILSD